MRILIVEDDPQLGDALAAGLRQLGEAADWFRNGREADAPLSAVPYDAVVLDLGLPGGDGMEWLARWRRRSLHVPVLILTARDAVEQRIAGLDAGADDYLVKPIGIDELAARLRALVRRSHGRSQSVWRHGPLEYDPAAKSVRWQGRPAARRPRKAQPAHQRTIVAHQQPGHQAERRKANGQHHAQPPQHRAPVRILHGVLALVACVAEIAALSDRLVVMSR